MSGPSGRHSPAIATPSSSATGGGVQSPRAAAGGTCTTITSSSGPGAATTRENNRVTVCAGHHLHGIHAGRIRAWGAAPDRITWELGVRPGRPPLLRLEGDRYVAR